MPIHGHLLHLIPAIGAVDHGLLDRQFFLLPSGGNDGRFAGQIHD